MKTIFAAVRSTAFRTAGCLALLLALAAPARASVISYSLGVSVPLDGSVDVAIDEGGDADLRFVDSFIPDVFHSVDLDGLGTPGTSFWASPDAFWVAPLVNPFDSTPFTATDPSIFIAGFNDTNPWMGVSGPAFLGGVFDLAGSLHQFYVALTLNTDTGEVFLDEVGYESEPLVAAIPEPSTISLLAIGAAGLTLLRRRARR